jgi:hypothetical protein
MYIRPIGGLDNRVVPGGTRFFKLCGTYYIYPCFVIIELQLRGRALCKALPKPLANELVVTVGCNYKMPTTRSCHKCQNGSVHCRMYNTSKAGWAANGMITINPL